MTRFKLLPVLLCALLGSTAWSKTGNELLDDLRKPSPQAGLAYIEGAIETTTLLNAMALQIAKRDNQPAPTLPEYCIPEAVTLDQAAGVVKLYLENNAANRQLSATILVFQAMRQAYPCK